MATGWSSATTAEKYGAGAGLGGGLASLGGLLFGSQEDPGKAYDEAMQKYGHRMGQGLGELRGHEEVGRGDITQNLQAAQAYGEPYRVAGAQGLNAYQGSLGLGGSAGNQAAVQAFHESPGFRYAMNEAMKQIQMQPGMRGTGLEQQALMKRAMGMANQEYGGWQNQLAHLAGMGQQSAEMAGGRNMMAGGHLADLGFGYGGRLSDMYQNMGQNEAAATLAKQQAQQQAQKDWWSGIGSAVGGIAGAAALFI